MYEDSLTNSGRFLFCYLPKSLLSCTSLDQRLVGTVSVTLPPSRMFLQSRYSSVRTTAIFLVLAPAANAAVAATPRPLLVDCKPFDYVAVSWSVRLVSFISASDPVSDLQRIVQGQLAVCKKLTRKEKKGSCWG
jgi:hypothetical protein